MKKLYISIWYVCFCLPLTAQISKGDMLIDFRSFFTVGKINANIPEAPDLWYSTDLYPRLGYMLNDHFMAGVNWRFNHGRSYYSEYGKSNTFVLGFSPFFRYYYFEKKGFMPFAFANTLFERVSRKYEMENIDFQSNKYHNFWLTAGLGLDYFLSKNIALEANVGTTLYESERVKGWNGKLFIRLGVQTFMGKKEEVPNGLMDRYLKKGNFIVGGDLGFFLRDNDRFYKEGIFSINAKPQASDFSVFPRLKYFTNDRTVISINPGLEISRNGSVAAQAVSLNIGYTKYIALAERLFFVPRAEVGSRYHWYTTYETQIVIMPPIIRLDTVRAKSDQVSLMVGSDLSVQYFTKGKTIFKGGFQLSFSNIYPNKINGSKLLSSEQYIYAGLDHFISTNLYLGAYLGHYMRRSEFAKGGQVIQLPYGQKNGQLRMNFSLGYFLFSKRNKRGNNR